jgi:hypothetical protein
MTSFQFGISERDLAVSLTIHKIRDRLQRAFLEEKQNKKFTQAQLARKLGADRSTINRQLMGRENIGLKRLAEFVWALDREVIFEMPKSSVPHGSNQPSQSTSEVKTSAQSSSSTAWVNYGANQQITVVKGTA